MVRGSAAQAEAGFTAGEYNGGGKSLSRLHGSPIDSLGWGVGLSHQSDTPLGLLDCKGMQT